MLCAFLLFGCRDRHKEAEQLLRSAKATLRHGELADAEKSAARGIRMVASSGDRVLEWKFRLLLCEASLLAHPGADVLAELRRPLPAEPGFAALAARKKMLEGRALFAQGKSVESGEALNAAHRLAVSAEDQETLSDIEILQGSRLLQQFQWRAAEATLSLALTRARSAGLPYEEAGALLNLGMSRVDRHRYDEAIDYFQRAAVIAAPESSTLYHVAQADLATCYYSLGEFDRAIGIQRQSIAQLERTGDQLHLQRVLGETGHTYQQQGDGKQAAEYLERALRIARKIDRKGDAAIWAGNLAALHSELGEWDKAERFNQEAIRIKSGLHSRTQVYNALNAARISAGRGQFAQGERQYLEIIATHKDDPAVLWEAHSELGRNFMLQRKPQDALGEFEAAVGIVEQTRSDLLNTEYKLPFLTRLIRLYQSYVDALIEQGDSNRALVVADSSRAQTLAGRFGSAPTRRQPAASFAKIARETGTTILTYWLGPKQSQAWVITPGGVRHVTLSGESEIANLVADYNEAIQHRLADPHRSRIPAGERLFQLLIEPVRQWVPAGSRIVIVPDGMLSGLNFETLTIPGVSPPRYWIEDVTIAIAPSINVLGGRRTNALRGRGLLVIGDPENVDAAYPPLKRAPVEIANVTRHYPAESRVVLRKKDAVPQAYRSADAAQFDAIHFTAHATANREDPLDSAVLLTGGKLYARDVLEIPLHAGLVTMSACRGAGSRMYTGEGLVGFAWAFLRAGARNVIAGLWDVNDQSTADLMDVIYDEFTAGRKPVDALRSAKLALIHSETNFRKPYYWGAFQIYTVDPLR
ncbi:MAG: CHAT domain-containing protein [Acidobacteriota bacterium]|nr:CHAT domain-containing protein [Acidobacteriota bacterium]